MDGGNGVVALFGKAAIAIDHLRRHADHIGNLQHTRPSRATAREIATRVARCQDPRILIPRSRSGGDADSEAGESAVADGAAFLEELL
jgi:hypothetical protein